MSKNCSICGNTSDTISFRRGFICDECLAYIRMINIDNSSQLVNENTLSPGEFYDAKPNSSSNT